MTISKPKSPARSIFRRLRKNESGLALMEFAFSMPILMGLGMYGAELSFLAIAHMKVSQTALNLADNASRMGQTSNGTATPTIQESDINEIFLAAALQTPKLAVLENGRVALTSLQVDTTTNPGVEQQFIGWQRCTGLLDERTQEQKDENADYGSAYDDDADNDGDPDTDFAGMGEAGSEVKAVEDSAVMYVEIEYYYQPLFGDLFIAKRKIKEQAAFNIRDDRNLAAGLFNDVGTATANCNKFSAT